MGTATGLRISAVDLTAFLDNCPADVLAAAGTGAQIKIYPAATPAYYLQGFIGAVGSSEGLGDEEVTNGGLETGDTTGWTPVNTNTTLAVDADARTGSYALKITEIGASNGGKAYQKIDNLKVAGALWAFVAYAKKIDQDRTYVGIGSTSSNCDTFQGSATTPTSYTNVASYFTSLSTSNYVTLIWEYHLTKSGLYDDISIMKVTAPSSSGVTILDAVGGNQSFSYKHASFPYNAASYSYEIISGHPATKRFGAVPFCTQRRNIW